MRRNGRVLLGLGLLGLGAWSVVPGLVHPTSTDAVVNAEVVTLRAPMDGQLATGLGVAVGDRVNAGDAVARVRPGRQDAARRDALALDLSVQRQLVAALAAEDSELARLDRDLAGRAATYRAAAGRTLALARAEADARVAAAEAERARVAAERARKEALFAKDLVAPAMIETARTAERAAEAALKAARAERDRMVAEGSAVRRGATVAGGGDDTSYAGQRRDEVRLKRAARQVEIAQAGVRLAELERLAAESGDPEAVLAAPVDGVVWRRLAAEGDAVRAGDPVLGVVDCDKLFLSAVLPRRFFAELKAGDRARAHLAGADKPVAAVVESVRAAGAVQANLTAAVAPVAEEGRDVVVTLAVRDARLGTRADNLCQVGQHARVTFQVPALAPLMDAMASALRTGGHAS